MARSDDAYEKTKSRIDKQYHNDAFALVVRSIKSKLSMISNYFTLHLDHKMLNSSKTLNSVGDWPASQQYIPERDPKTLILMRKSLANMDDDDKDSDTPRLHAGTLYELISAFGPEHVHRCIGLFLDGTEMWDTKQSTDTTASTLKLAFEKQLFAEEAALAVTVCGRSKGKKTNEAKRIREDIDAFALDGGYVASPLQWPHTQDSVAVNGQMIVLLFRLARRPLPPPSGQPKLLDDQSKSAQRGRRRRPRKESSGPTTVLRMSPRKRRLADPIPANSANINAINAVNTVVADSPDKQPWRRRLRSLAPDPPIGY